MKDIILICVANPCAFEVHTSSLFLLTFNFVKFVVDRYMPSELHPLGLCSSARFIRRNHGTYGESRCLDFNEWRRQRCQS